METLYAGLDRQDVSSIGSALRDADISFDVSADGTAVMVRYGQTAQARMLLAEKGLPHSSNAGYELYDKMGSLGLTSFMQDVTRVRALEGELSRTIQSMSGIKAARVHIVLPDEGSFRRVKQPPSASVVIRAATYDDAHMAQAIRHLVAAAVPAMTVDEVTVLSTDGHHPGLGRRHGERRARQGARSRTDGRPDHPGQHPQDADPLSIGASQPADQRRGQAQHRHAADCRDRLQPRFARRTLDPRGQGDQSSQNNSTQAPDHRQPESAAGQDPALRRQAVLRGEPEARGAQQLRGLLQDHHDGQRRLWHRASLGRGGDQPGGPARRASATSRPPMQPTSGWPISSSSSHRRPGSTRRAATPSRSWRSISSTAGATSSRRPRWASRTPCSDQSATLINALVILAVTAVLVLFVVRPLIRHPGG